MDWVQDLWIWVGQTNPDTWGAAAAWLTFIVAVVAGFAALGQVREARRLRQEQAQPNVVAYMEPSPASQQILDLVVKNFGTTVARNVQMKSDPPLSRTTAHGTDSELVAIFEEIPVLVPGQEWRIYWDSSVRRKDAGLPERYEVTVSYKDSQSKPMDPTKVILDWGVYKSRMWADAYGQHHAAKALRDLASTAKKWSEFGGGLNVYSRDGDEKDDAKRKRHEEIRARLEKLEADELSEQAEEQKPAEDSLAAPEPSDSTAANEAVSGDDRAS